MSYCFHIRIAGSLFESISRLKKSAFQCQDECLSETHELKSTIGFGFQTVYATDIDWKK